MSKSFQTLAFKLMDVIVILTMVLSSPMSVFAAPLSQDSNPVLGTDKADYTPGESAHITGTGFAPGSYNLAVLGPDSVVVDWGTVSADNDGNLTADSPALRSPGSYVVSALAVSDNALAATASFTVTEPPTPTDLPTEEPTATEPPTEEPTQEPTATEPPTAEPTQEPTATEPPTATSEPTSTVEPTPEPTQPPQPFIQSDKEDYFAGELVTLTSGNWQPEEAVHIFVNDDIGQTWNHNADVTADENGAFTYQFYLPNWFVATYRVAATGATSGVARTTFTDSQGSYNLDFAAADPGDSPTYPKVTPSQLACPATSGGSGTASDPLANAIFGSPKNAVESLAPEDMILGQIVPFELEIAVNGSTAPENGNIQIVADFATKTTSGGNFGYDPAYMIYCAFVDTADSDSLNLDGNEQVSSFSSTLLSPGTSNEEIRGTIRVTGLDDGDRVVVEIWLVLKSTIPLGVSGNVQAELDSAKTCTNANCTTGNNIPSGNQTVPLLRVQEFFSSNADVGVTKTDSPDPVLQGNQLTYTVTVTNNGPATANGVVVTDVLDPNTSYVSSSIPCTGTTTLTCSVGNLDVGISTSFTITVLVSSSAPTNITPGSSAIGGTCTVGSQDLCNVVSVDAINTDTVSSNNSDSEPTNVLPLGGIVINKIAVGGDATFSYTTTGSGLSDFNITSTSGSGSQSFTGIAPGAKTVTESAPPSSWDFTSVSCSDPDGGTTTSGQTANIDLDSGETVTCTFTNTRRGHIIVDKVTSPAADPTSFNFDANGGTSPAYTDFNLTDAATPNDQELKPDSYSVTESVPSGWTLSNLSCALTVTGSGTSTFNTSSPPAASITLGAGDTVTCTFTNTKQFGSIVVIKDTVPDDLQDFAFTGSGPSGFTFGGGFNLDDDGNNGNGLSNTATFSSLNPGSYSVAETPVTGFDTVSSCISNIGDTETAGSIELDPNETVTCTFTNTKRGTIIVEKQTDPDGAAGSFTFTGTASGTISDNGQITVSNLVPGTYTSTETNPAPNFVLTNIVCDDGASATPSTFDVGTRTATFKLDAGETVKCTFTNTRQQGTVIVKKVMVGGTGSFDFAGTPSGTISTNNGTITANVTPGTYISTETVLSGWDLTDITCDDDNSTGDESTATATFNVANGETVTCTFTNTKRGTIIVEKQTNPDNSSQSFEFDPSYAANFFLTDGQQNNSGPLVAGTYSVAEVNTPADWVLDSANCSSSIGDTETAGSIELDAGETVTCVFTNTKLTASLTVTKSPDQTDVCNGSSVEYTYEVINTGTAALTVNLVDDNGTPGITSDDIDVDGGTGVLLGPGASQQFTASALITGTVTNTVTATGTSAGGQTATASANATVTGHDCSIIVTKSPSATNICDDGEVTYTYTVTNNSDEFTWTGTLTDDQLGTIDASITLGPDEDETFTASANITGSVTNIVTASGTFDDDSGTSASDTASATVTSHDCSITVTKSPSATNVCDDGEVIYTYTVTNNSDQFTWTGTLTDDQLGPIGGTITLGPGQSTGPLTASANITGTVTNTATASGEFDDDSTTSASDTASATVTSHDCSITVTKSPSATNVCDGGAVTYTYTVTNNSDEFTWTGTLTDDQLGPINGTITLTPGETETFTASANITGTVTNMATASGTFDDDSATSASDDASATVESHDCSIMMTKSPSTANICNGSNTSVTYTYVVTNNSDFFNVSGSVIDNKGTPGNLADDVIIGTFTDLAPGGTATFTQAFTINGTTTNTATAGGAFDDPDGTVDSATASATVTGHNCTISITKTPSTANVCNDSDTEVTYTYVVTNDSDFYSVSGTVTDDQFGAIGNFGPLAPGATATLTKVATINGTVTNIATATGTFNDTNSTTDSDTATATVTGHDCSVSITKTPSVANVCAGSDTEVEYTITVTNNSTLFDWTGDVEDDVLGILATGVTIPAGQSVTYTPTHTVNTTTTNTVTADGAFNDTDASAATDSASATVTAYDCTISITKTPSVANVCIGSDTEVTYTITVTNNSTLFDWTGDVTDNVLGDVALDVTIPAGETAEYFPTHTVNATTTNTVTADGTFNDSDSSSASDTATATVTAFDCTISITKTPSVANVCIGSDTEVEYTITVTNNSTLFDWTGDVEDTVLGVLATGVTIPAGQSVSYTPTHVVNSTTTNTVTADGTFNDSDNSSASDTASATVTAFNCTISITKTPSVANVCTGSGTEVEYTITVINNSTFFDWTGDVEDDVLGILATGVTIPANGSVTYTPTHVVNSTTTNTVTATGAFNDSDVSAATDSASATVTAYDCTISITKTPSVENVCIGSDKEVEYTITVTNNSDLFDWTGDVTDTVLGDIALDVTIPAGESVIYTPTHTVNTTTSNTVTAEGAFNDSDASAATDSASATVTAHDCTISITKTPSTANVCNGSNTEVTYTYVVTNNSDFYSVSGTVTDDQFGTIGNFGPLGPGDSATLTKVAAINGTVTNIATATGTFNDTNGTTDSDTATATVTGRDCTITVTKSPSATNVCNGATVTYTYTVTNNSDLYTWSGSLEDDQLGTIADPITLDPGETQTFTANAPITGTVVNTATASGAFDDPNDSSASDSASATVTGQVCRIIVVKHTLPDGDAQLFAFSGDLNGSIGDGGSISRDVLTPGTYSTTETVPAGWDLTSISCSDSNSSGSMNTATYNVSLGETVTCTFTNTKRGHIIVDKVTNPSGDIQSFSFDASGGTSPAYVDFNLTDAAAPNDQTLKPGSYSVVEGALPGWDLTGLTCNDANGSISPGTRTANITLDPGETVTCTFTNTKRGSIKIIKDAVPNDAQDFTFTRSFGANFMLDDDSTVTLQNNVTFTNLVPGAYSVTESAVAGWDLTGLSCNDANGTTSPGTRTANIALDAGENVVCTFTNTKRGTIIVEKQTSPDGAPGTFTFTGTAAGTIADNGTITVPNLVPGIYTSTESDPSVILFSLTSIVCNDGSSANPSTGNLTTRTATFKLDPGETVRCVFTNTKNFHAGTIGFWKNWRNHYTNGQVQLLVNYLKTNNPRIYNKDLVNNNSDDFTIAKWDAIFNVGTSTPRDQMILAQFTGLKLNLAITQLDGTSGLVQKNSDICLAGTINVSGISGATAFFGTATPTISQVVNAVESRWTGNLTTNRNNWTFNFSNNTQRDMIISVVSGINEGTLVMSSGCP